MFLFLLFLFLFSFFFLFLFILVFFFPASLPPHKTVYIKVYILLRLKGVLSLLFFSYSYSWFLISFPLLLVFFFPASFFFPPHKSSMTGTAFIFLLTVFLTALICSLSSVLLPLLSVNWRLFPIFCYFLHTLYKA